MCRTFYVCMTYVFLKGTILLFSSYYFYYAISCAARIKDDLCLHLKNRHERCARTIVSFCHPFPSVFFPFALLLLFIINVYFTYLWRQSTICDTIVRLGKNRSMLASLSSYTYLLKNNKYFKFFLLTSNIKPKASQT